MTRIISFMRQIKLSFKYSYYKKIILLLITSLTITFFLFSLLITYTINNNYKNEQIRTNEAALLQSNSVSKNVIGDIFRFTSNAYNNNSVLTDLLYANTYSTNSSIQCNRLMAELLSYNSLITSVYIINFNGDYVCSNYGTTETIRNFYDQDIITYLKDKKPSQSAILLKPRIVNGVTTDGNNYSKHFISIIYHSTVNGAFVINLNTDSFLQLLGDYEASSSTGNIIINRYGQLLYHYADDRFTEDYSENPLYKQILENTKNYGTIHTTINGVPYYTSFYRNIDTGLTFIKLTKNLLFDTSNSLLIKAAIYSLIFLLLSLLVCLFVSKTLYKPIQTLKQSIAANSPNEFLNEDEFTQIHRIYNNVYEQNCNLKQNIQYYKKLNKAKIIKQLIDSDFAAIPPNLNKLEEIEISLEGPNYLVVLAGIDTNTCTTYPAEDNALVLYSISNIMNELSESICHMEFAQVGHQQLVCIVNMQDSTKVLTTYMKQTIQLVDAYFHTEISFGVGTFVSELELISLSYRHATTALNHRYVTGKQTINYYTDLNIVEDAKQLYPLETEKSIKASIKGLQNEEIKSNLHNFFQEINTYNYNRIILYTLQLNLALKQFEITNKLPSMEEYEITETSFINNTCDRIEEIFIKRCISLSCILAEIKSHNSEKNAVVTTVISLIESNIYDSNLSVEFLANEVHLSVNYLRNIFKESLGTSLSNYIIEKKLHLICSLLTETDMNIQTISDKLGFTTRNYFFTFFKKHTGCTPNQYRKLHQNDYL